MIDDHLLKEGTSVIGSRSLASCKKLLNEALDLQDKPWHDWDAWAKGLE